MSILDHFFFIVRDLLRDAADAADHRRFAEAGGLALLAAVVSMVAIQAAIPIFIVFSIGLPLFWIVGRITSLVIGVAALLRRHSKFPKLD